MPETFDAVVIGAGQAGPALATKLAGTGMSVAVVERKLVGGTCVNVGCTPTKAMVASAHAAFVAGRAADFGVVTSSSVRVDLRKVLERKNGIVMKSRNGVTDWITSTKGCTLVRGHARFESPTTVRVGDRVLEAPRIFLNVGARPSVAIKGADATPYLTSTTILDLEALPEHLIIVGSSYIGLEFAQMFRRFGSAVTVIERNAQLLPHEDEDVSAALRAMLEAEGISFRTNATCLELHGESSSASVILDCNEQPISIVGSHILLAIGRVPNTDDLGLDAAGIAVDERGYVRTDEHLRTTSANVWAMGDCNGRGAFTHTAWNDYEIVADNLLDKGSRSTADRISVYALYTDPPMAHIGMTEKQVRASGRPALLAKRPMSKVSRAVEKGETIGFMKALVDAETRMILGASIFGVGGDEAIHSMLTCMYAKMPFNLISQAMYIHPTVSELIPTMLQEMTPLE
jgi:pyruvate/2-oxoglutarate dehydrogenase complex dihydrolipoamide dehydrogenase (E3) component